MTHAEYRLNADQIKRHNFFYGVDWDSIRQIDSPFVPHLRSLTDTSYFPTEEIDQAPEEPAAAQGQANKDLAFLGCVKHQKICLAPFPDYLHRSRYTFKRFSISGQAS